MHGSGRVRILITRDGHGTKKRFLNYRSCLTICAKKVEKNFPNASSEFSHRQPSHVSCITIYLILKKIKQIKTNEFFFVTPINHRQTTTEFT